MDVPQVDPELASKIVWLDGLVQNPDRTVKNPNLLWSQGALWLINHGASLGFQHDWPRVTEQSRDQTDGSLVAMCCGPAPPNSRWWTLRWPHDCIAESWNQR